MRENEQRKNERRLTSLQITEEMYGGKYVRSDLCPYCIGIPWTVEITDGNTGEKTYSLLCDHNHARISSGRFPTIREATLSWNHLTDVYKDMKQRAKAQNPCMELAWDVEEDKKICEHMGWFDLENRFEGGNGLGALWRMRVPDRIRALLQMHEGFTLRYADSTVATVIRQGGEPDPWCIRVVAPNLMITRYSKLEVHADALNTQDLILDLNKVKEMIVRGEEVGCGDALGTQK